MQKIKQFFGFWLGILVWIGLNGVDSIREAPSIGMLIMYVVGYFRLTRLD